MARPRALVEEGSQEIAVVTSNVGLSTTLMGLEATFLGAARANITTLYAGEDLTQTELNSMIIVEQLKLINGMDLAAVLMRGKLINQIETGALWATHPGQYSSLQEMARAQGISMSELSNVRTLTNIIFPYMENSLHINVAEAWEKIGKSNFRDLTAVLAGLISGDRLDRASLQTSVENQLNEVYATHRSSHIDPEAGDYELTRDQAVEIATRSLLEGSEGVPNRVVRERIRPVRTEPINMTFVKFNGRTFVLAEVSGDQGIMLQNRMHGYMEPMLVEISDDLRTRQMQVSRVREIREIMNMFTEE